MRRFRPLPPSSTFVLLGLFGCGSPSVQTVPTPDDTSAPTPPECVVEGVFEGSFDCTTLDPCAPDVLAERLACCDCDAFYCEAPDCGWDMVPEPFPADSSAELSFESGLEQVLWPVTQRVWFGPDPDGLLVVPKGQMIDATPATCARTGNTFRCETPFTAGATVYEMLEIRVTDADGDGVVDGGEIRVHGRPAYPSTGGPYGVTQPLEADTTGSPARFYELPILPTDPAILTLTEPVAAASVPESLGGVGPIEVRLRGESVVTGLRSLGLAEWGSTLTLDGLTDLAGNAIAVEAGSIAADPGPADENLGFELDSGWGTRRVAFQADLLGTGLSPTEGELAAYVEHGGSMVGELDIPAGATTLSFDWGRSDNWDVATLTVELVETDGTRTALWQHTDPPFGPGDLNDPIPFQTVSVDVSAWSGEHVFLRFEVDNEEWSGWFEPEVDWLRSTPPAEAQARVAFDNLRFEEDP